MPKFNNESRQLEKEWHACVLFRQGVYGKLRIHRICNISFS